MNKKYLILQEIDGSWHDVTDQYFPELDLYYIEDQLYDLTGSSGDVAYPKLRVYGLEYSLPREGVDIIISEPKTGEAIYKIIWNNRAFVAQKLR
ncbi:hypothetical protein ACFL2B_03205 [Patescibacteria group bacterium]